MKYKELRELFINDFSKSREVKKYKNYSVINKGFSGNFNLSFSEPEMLEEFGSLINIKHKLLYTKIQPCIRFEDFLKILSPLSKKSYMYLGLFDMAGICLCYPKPNGLEEQTKILINQVWNFLTNKLKLEPTKLFVKCFAGKSIKQATKGKYKIDKKIEKDNLSINEWIKIGLPKDNILLDKSRDTFLALHIHRPTPWGYRTEILYKLKNKEFIDLGTIEYFPWKPVFRKDKIVDIVSWENSCCLAVFGLERLNFVTNNLEHIRECDIIKPLFSKILEDSKIKNQAQAFLLCECIRVSQRVLTDSLGYANLSRHRKKKLTKYIQQIYKLFKKMKIPIKNLRDYLEINAKLQEWYPELKKNVELVNTELLNAFNRKF